MKIELTTAVDPASTLEDLDQGGLRQAILELSDIITTSNCIGTVYRVFAKVLSGLVEFDRANIALFDAFDGPRVIHYQVGQERRERPPRHSRNLVGTGTKMVSIARQTVIDGDISGDISGYISEEGPTSRGSGNVLRCGSKSSINLPLICRGRVIGMLTLRSCRPFAFGLQEQALLERLVSLIAPPVGGEAPPDQAKCRSHGMPFRKEFDGSTLDSASSEVRDPETCQPPFDAGICGSLSRREREVLEAIARGAINDEIASDLHISANTVKAHVRKVLKKLRVSNRVQAALLARGRIS